MITAHRPRVTECRVAGADADTSQQPFQTAVRVFSATVVCCSVLAAAQCEAARAEEREWKPRRHHRRLGERYSNAWAQEVVEEQERVNDDKQAARRRREQLRREQEEAEAAVRRAEEAARRKKAEAMLAEQKRELARATDLPFSVQVGGQEIAPYIIWGGLAVAGLGALRGVIGGVQAVRRRPAGKWVYDRSLGGKKVWVPDAAAPGGSPAAPDRPLLSDTDFDRLTSIAAAAATGGRASQEPDALPSWWNPGPRVAPDESLRAVRQDDAERLLARMEAARNVGNDFNLRDIVRLREMSQEAGGVSLAPRTVGSRDALYRTAVDAAVAVAADPAQGYAVLGDAAPTRFLSALATDINLPAERAVSMVAAAVAASARARLVDALAGIKEDAGSEGDDTRNGETAAVISLLRLSSLMEKLPVLTPGSTAVALIAESLQRSFTVDELRRTFYLAGQLDMEAAPLLAALLGFDPAVVVPQLQADMAAAAQ